MMKILLNKGFCHTLAIDKDITFFGSFTEARDLLLNDKHILSGNTHDSMLVERNNRFINKSRKVLCNESDSVRIRTKSIIISFYGWNHTLYISTNISNSLVIKGHASPFPIDLFNSKKSSLEALPDRVDTFPRDQDRLLPLCW